jgi:predicted RNA-binding Zn ribbon-like protein
MAETDAANIRLIGERLCLDFVNTVGARHQQDHRSYIKDYADLTTWSEHAGIISDAVAVRLLQAAAKRPAEAAAMFAQALELREAMYRVFYAVVQEVVPPPADLETAILALVVAMAHAQLIPTGEGYIWGWPEHENALDQMLWPIARDAAELLTSGELALVRECQSEGGCGWLFVDTSKNHRRRWCSMEECGNSAKVRRFRERRKDAA